MLRNKLQAVPLVWTDQFGQADSAQSTVTSSIVLALRSHGDAYQSSETWPTFHLSQTRGFLQSLGSRSPTIGDSCEAYHILGQTLTQGYQDKRERTGQRHADPISVIKTAQLLYFN
ncbi:hypothetical protein HGM15179_019712 [Zosterops borbonicus]|uniref:Uncharacterized protein n=1 Tax=Zosterops borbonicus TaxID=364589 RepID=A0A8K1DAG9_9PASS|nr:hypothetical protein HGM15179_019712 [Zosterops borbonicus]